MSIFAKVENGIVTDIIVADQEFIDSSLETEPSLWLDDISLPAYAINSGVENKRTLWIKSSNEDGHLRMFHATIGCVYNAELDIFYPPSPYPSWVFNKQTLEWQAPIEMPFPPDQPPTPVSDGFKYFWNEDILNWDKKVIPLAFGETTTI